MLMLAACAALALMNPAHAQTGERTGEQIVKAQCVKCHEAGVSGAPKIDDRIAWSQRMKRGLDATVRSATKGHGAMPARGGLADLTDTELRGAILYMFYPAGAALKPAAAPAPAAPADPRHKSAGGMEIYLGIVPAESAQVKQPRPSGKGYYHVNISLQDSSTRAPIRDAQLEARVSNAMGGATRTLDLVTANDAVSYGSFFRMPGRDPYTIAVKIRRAGSAVPAEARFEFRP
jgi:cytochrome c5